MPYVNQSGNGSSWIPFPANKKEFSFAEAVEWIEARRNYEIAMATSRMYTDALKEEEDVKLQIRNIIAQATKEQYIKKKGEEVFNKSFEAVSQLHESLRIMPINVQGKLRLACKKALEQLTDFRTVGVTTFGGNTKSLCYASAKRILEELAIHNSNDYLRDLNLVSDINPQIHEMVDRKYKESLKIRQQLIEDRFQYIIKELAKIPDDFISLEVLESYTCKN